MTEAADNCNGEGINGVNVTFKQEEEGRRSRQVNGEWHCAP